MNKLPLILAVALISLFSTAYSSDKIIHVFLVGPGLVGGEVLNQINDRFSSDKPLEIRVVGLANSRVMHFDAAGIALNNWKDELSLDNEPMAVDEFIDRMVHLNVSNPVFVDCTSSQMIADSYQRILQSSIPVVTPNKKANSGPLSDYCALRGVMTQNHVKFLYDCNVGAGLPFISTIKSIKRSGDTVVRLEAILSGTLSYLFNTFDGSTPFSNILREAQSKGYTEPDPREDLNGLDMARKFLILARETGLGLEMKDIVIEPFLPDACFSADSVADFYLKLGEFDEQFSLLAKQANKEGQVLRFTGVLEEGRAVLSLKVLDKNHPFSSLSDTDNIASIQSRVYAKNPIVIKGPGAGACVTAANVLSNIVEAGGEK